jgi:hypothetical protein
VLSWYSILACSGGVKVQDRLLVFQVLDEIYRVLKVVNVDPNPPRAHELLQELRDISSMAMEHFDDKISPHLKTLMPAPLSSNELRQMLTSSKSLAASSTLGLLFGLKFLTLSSSCTFSV